MFHLAIMQIFLGTAVKVKILDHLKTWESHA